MGPKGGRGVDIEQTAIDRLRLASDMSLAYYQQPLIVTTSGGKDSDICLELARRAGIPYEVQHSLTTADAPQTVYHVREQFRRLELAGVRCTINYPMYKGKRTSMWALIPQKLGPPTRVARYCCDVLKEQGGNGRMITTGVRWAESSHRANSRGIYERTAKDPQKRIILSNDNDDRRRLFEDCRLKAKRVCNPIVDWEDGDVWEYIRAEKIETNPLYDMGFRRVGCIGCPMAGKGRYAEFRAFPAYERAYKRAFGWMLAARRAADKPCNGPWATVEGLWRWWMEDDNLDGQLDFWGAQESEEERPCSN